MQTTDAAGVTADESAAIVIAATVGLILALLFVLLRVYLCLYVRAQAASWDDWSSIAAALVFIAQTAVVFVEISWGLGKQWKGVSLLGMQKAVYADDILYVVITWLTKCSIACLLLRLAQVKRHVMAAWAYLGIATLFMVVSVFTVALRCHLRDPWVFIGRTCTAVLERCATIAALDILTEVALFIVAVFAILRQQTPLNKKSLAMLPFVLRLLVIAPTAVRIYYISRFLSASDATLTADQVYASLCTQIQLSYAIIATTIPCLRPSLLSTKSDDASIASRSSVRLSHVDSAKSAHPLTTLQPPTPPSQTFGLSLPRISLAGERSGFVSQRRKKLESLPRIRWDGTDYSVAVETLGGSTRSRESQLGMISKNTEWQVEWRQRWEK